MADSAEQAETAPFKEEVEYHPDMKQEKETPEDQRIRIRVIILVVAVLVLVGVAFAVGYVVRLVVHRCEEPSPSIDTDQLFQDAAENISSSNIEKQLKYFTTTPHVGGSEESHKQALYMKKEWLKHGLDKVELKRYDILLSFPKNPGLARIIDDNGIEIFSAQQSEKTLLDDEKNKDVLPPFNAYSGSDNVTGPLVFVNYAQVEDFDKLKEIGVKVAGHIVIAKYGKIFRGDKERHARKEGAIGLILYSDPKDVSPGVSPNQTYPKTWWLPSSGVQRGTLLLRAGDALTEGYPSIDGMYRRPINESDLPQLPVYPISGDDAKRFLELLTENEAPKEWKGDLPIDYNLKMSSSANRSVNLYVDMKFEKKPVYNVIGTIKGAVEPDRLVLFGNHRDAWVFGASDPSSGTAALMETVRVIGTLRKERKWRPRRTMVFLSWGAEEHGLLGSTEWVEDFTNLIKNRAVAYLNVDIAVQGNFSFRLKSSPLLDSVMFEATKKVLTPNGSAEKYLFDDWKSKLPDKKHPSLPRTSKIGSGSDYAALYHRLGIPSVDFRYTLDTDRLKVITYPVYHSVHDSFHWMANFVDRGFLYHRAVSQVWVHVGKLLTESIIIPFNVTRYAQRIKDHVQELKTEYNDQFKAQDIKLDYLEAAAENLTATAKKFHNFLSSVNTKDPLDVRMANDRLLHFEKSFINPQGLPGRPFKRHMIYAPSAQNSYAGSSFPGLVDSIYEAKKTGKWNEVKKQLSLLVYYIRSATQILAIQDI